MASTGRSLVEEISDFLLGPEAVFAGEHIPVLHDLIFVGLLVHAINSLLQIQETVSIFVTDFHEGVNVVLGHGVDGGGYHALGGGLELHCGHGGGGEGEANELHFWCFNLIIVLKTSSLFKPAY